MGGGGEAGDNSTVCPAKMGYYDTKVRIEDAYTWCVVYHSGQDVILFAGLAVVVMCLWQTRFNTLLTLISGFILQLILYHINIMDYLSNSTAWWLGIQPYELFFYVFLPPLLLEAGLKIDIFLFKKVVSVVLVLAFGVVICSTALLIPIMLYVFNLRAYGWTWKHVALFGAMVAPTDAVAIISVMKSCGGPRKLRVILEGESLLNDASSITLFSVFIGLVEDLYADPPVEHSAGGVVVQVLVKTIILAVGGFGIGLAFGVVMHIIMRWLNRINAPRDSQIALTVAVGYLSFYVANSPCKVSGVVSVAVFALYGAATSRWDSSIKLEEGRAFEVFWDTLAFIVNAVVFFYSGVAIANFILWSSGDINEYGKTLEYLYIVGMVIPIWLAVFFNRFLWLFLFQPVYRLAGSKLTLQEMAFLTFSGLRGSVSLIMAQAVVTEVTAQNDVVVKAEVVLFAALLVLMTLLLHSPLLSRVLYRLKLATYTTERLEMRKRAVMKLKHATEKAVEELQADHDEFLVGINWKEVALAVDHMKQYKLFLNPNARESRISWVRQRFKGWKGFKRGVQSSKGSVKVDKPEGAAVDAMAKTVEGRTHHEVQNSIHASKSSSLIMRKQDERMSTKMMDTGSKKLPDVREGGPHHDAENGSMHEARAYTAEGRAYNAEDTITSEDTRTQGWTTGYDAETSITSVASSTIRFIPKQRKTDSKEAKHGDGSDSDNEENDVVIGDVPFSRGTRAEPAPLAAVGVQHSIPETVFESGSANVDGTVDAPTQEDVPQDQAAQMADLRIRLAASMKRYFHHKRMEGLLSSKSQRILDSACDLQVDDPSQPLSLWGGIEREVVGFLLVRLVSRLLLWVRRAHLAVRRWRWSWLRTLPKWITFKIASLLMRWLSRRMTMACEVAIEYELALRHNPLVHWLEDSHASDTLLAEVEAEKEKVQQFILDREVEAPDRFNAIQTYRGTLAVLRRQLDTVDLMYKTGMIDEGERDLMRRPIEKVEVRVTSKGPKSKPPLLKEVLRSLPFLRTQPRDVIKMLMANGTLVEYPADQIICEFASNQNMYVVINGVVAILYDTVDVGFRASQDCRLSLDGGMGASTREYFLASGGVFGLYNALSGGVVPGRGRALAKGRALGSGPLVYVCNEAVFDRIRKHAEGGDEVYVQLLHDMYRMSALYCVSRLQGVLLLQITHLLKEAATGRVKQSARRGAAAVAAGKARKAGKAAMSSAEAAARDAAAREEAARKRLLGLFATDDGDGDDDDDAHKSESREDQPAAPQQVAAESSSDSEVDSEGDGDDADHEMEDVHRTFNTTSAAAFDRVTEQQLDSACHKQARELYSKLKPLLALAQLLELEACVQYVQCTTIVVMKGALVTTSHFLDSLQGPGLIRDTDGSIHLQAPFVLPWVWEGMEGGPIGIEFTAHPDTGATILCCIETDAEADSSWGNTHTFTLGQDLPLGQDLRTLLRSMSHKHTLAEGLVDEEQDGHAAGPSVTGTSMEVEMGTLGGDPGADEGAEESHSGNGDGARSSTGVSRLSASLSGWPTGVGRSSMGISRPGEGVGRSSMGIGRLSQSLQDQASRALQRVPSAQRGLDRASAAARGSLEQVSFIPKLQVGTADLAGSQY